MKMHRYILFTVLCMVAVLGIPAQASQHSATIVVTTVDENGEAIRADSVQWWLKGKRNKQYDFQYANELCNCWQSEYFQLKEEMVIYATASVLRKDDTACWDLYAGKRLLKGKMNAIQVVLYFTGTACS